MDVLQRIEELIGRIRWLNDGMIPGHQLAEELAPLLGQVADALRSTRGRWLTLAEAQRETGRSSNYFVEPLISLANQSRLENWREQHLADQTDEGLWLIHPLAAQEASRPDAVGRHRSVTRDPVEAVAHRLTSA